MNPFQSWFTYASDLRIYAVNLLKGKITLTCYDNVIFGGRDDCYKENKFADF